MLTRLKLTGIRDQLDNLLDEVTRKELTFCEALAHLLEAEVARKDQRRLAMGLSIAKFLFVRTLEDLDYNAQPSVDEKQVREPPGGHFRMSLDTGFAFGVGVGFEVD